MSKCYFCDKEITTSCIAEPIGFGQFHYFHLVPCLGYFLNGNIPINQPKDYSVIPDEYLKET